MFIGAAIVIGSETNPMSRKLDLSRELQKRAEEARKKLARSGACTRKSTMHMVKSGSTWKCCVDFRMDRPMAR